MTTTEPLTLQVLLAVRGLGKSKSVLQQMPRHMRRPEKAVLFLMESASEWPGMAVAISACPVAAQKNKDGCLLCSLRSPKSHGHPYDPICHKELSGTLLF